MHRHLLASLSQHNKQHEDLFACLLAGAERHAVEIDRQDLEKAMLGVWCQYTDIVAMQLHRSFPEDWAPKRGWAEGRHIRNFFEERKAFTDAESQGGPTPPGVSVVDLQRKGDQIKMTIAKEELGGLTASEFKKIDAGVQVHTSRLHLDTSSNLATVAALIGQSSSTLPPAAVARVCKVVEFNTKPGGAPGTIDVGSMRKTGCAPDDWRHVPYACTENLGYKPLSIRNFVNCPDGSVWRECGGR